MARILGITLGVAAAGAFALAAARSSAAIALLGVVFAAAGVAAFLSARSATPATPSPAAVDKTGRDRAVLAESDPPEDPTEPARSTPRIFAPAAMDLASVADALLSSARSVGAAHHVSVWRADGASGEPVLVSETSSPAGANPGREGVALALAEGTTIMQELTLGSGNSLTWWRYLMPITTSGLRAVAAVDFEGNAPDAEGLTHVASSFRLPLAAGILLGVARQESNAARMLLESAHDLARILDSDAVVKATLKRAVDLTGATSGSVMLYGDDGSTLRIAASVGLPTHVVRDTAVRPGDGIAGWVALSGQPLVVEDLPGRTTPARSRGVRSAVSVPMQDEDGVVGVLNVGTGDYPSTFSSTDLESLEALARQAAVSLRNSRAVASASDIYLDTLRALALALETKDPYALGGTDRVMEYANKLGGAMGLGLEEAQALEVAAMLHDIGMSSAGEAALVSARPLSTVERGMLKMHPVIAAEILEQAPALREVTPIVYHHHERYDGTGYAGGVAGEAIPLGARILAVADAYVAMTSDRPYRAALSEDEALEELRINAGTQFDPVVVDTFVSMVSTSPNRVREGRA